MYIFLDERFPPDHKITLIFTKSAENFDRAYDDVLIFQNPLIRKESVSSLGDLLPSAQHTQGPVDGSLYATVAKSQQQQQTLNQLTEQNIRTIESSQRLNTPISKNSRILSTILEWDNVRNGENGSPIDHNGHDYSRAVATTNASKPMHESNAKSYAKSPLMESYDSGIFSHEVSSSNSKFFNNKAKRVSKKGRIPANKDDVNELTKKERTKNQ